MNEREAAGRAGEWAARCIEQHKPSTMGREELAAVLRLLPLRRVDAVAEATARSVYFYGNLQGKLLMDGGHLQVLIHPVTRNHTVLTFHGDIGFPLPFGPDLAKLAALIGSFEPWRAGIEHAIERAFARRERRFPTRMHTARIELEPFRLPDDARNEWRLRLLALCGR